MALVTKGGGGVLVTMVKRESKAVVKLMALRPNFELSKAKTHRLEAAIILRWAATMRAL